MMSQPIFSDPFDSVLNGLIHCLSDYLLIMKAIILAGRYGPFSFGSDKSIGI